MDINVSCQEAAMHGTLISIYIAKPADSCSIAGAGAAGEVALLEEKQGHAASLPWSSEQETSWNEKE
jgi:hypothetical protein